MFSADKRQRIHDVAHDLMGTAKSLHDVTTQDERDDAEFLQLLDGEVRECTTCGWWSSPDDFGDDDECLECEEDAKDPEDDCEVSVEIEEDADIAPDPIDPDDFDDIDGLNEDDADYGRR